MATSTTNFGLTKPAYNEAADVAVINGNMDTVDTVMGVNRNLAKGAQAGLAIVADGDTHAAITAGQYVYVRNNTHSLAEGLYVASANVSANGNITGSNMTAVSGGGLNALNSKLARTSDNCTAATGITLNNVVVERSGNVCVLHGSASIPSSLAGNNTEVLEIPAGFRPVNSVYLKLYSKYNSNLGLFTFYINAGGKLCTNTGSSTFTGDILFEITYIC